MNAILDDNHQIMDRPEETKDISITVGSEAISDLCHSFETDHSEAIIDQIKGKIKLKLPIINNNRLTVI